MLMAAYNDFFNIDNNIKGSIITNKDSQELKKRILNSVKTVIEKDKKHGSNKDEK